MEALVVLVFWFGIGNVLAHELSLFFMPWVRGFVWCAFEIGWWGILVGMGVHHYQKHHGSK